MMNEINKQLQTLFRAYEKENGLFIQTHFRLEGDPINFRFDQEDSKYARLTTCEPFSQWMAWCTGDWTKATPMIEALAKPYGAAWDKEAGALYLRFRRNEMSLAEAVMRLQQAAAAVCSLASL